jgi:hypothetical protein
MRCYQHQNSEANAVCVSCGRGLCSQCQQSTLDQRILCGLPQCAVFERRQTAGHFATAQTCAGNASSLRLLAVLMRSMGVILIFFCIGIFIWEFVIQYLYWKTLTNPVVLFGAICAFAALAALAISFSRKLRVLEQNFEDIARELK